MNARILTIALRRLLECIGLSIFVLLPSFASGKSSNKNHFLQSCIDSKTAIRLFYQPGGENYFHAPLILRVAKAEDARINTAPMMREGRTAFITMGEMDHLIKVLRTANLLWHMSDEVTKFKRPSDLLPTGKMQVTLRCSSGIRESSVKPKDICKFIGEFDPALTTPRALWEVNLFRYNLYCDVPGFDPKAFPDHNEK